MAYLIRPAEPDEAARVRALVREAYALYVPRMGREPAPMLADYAALIGEGHVVVAEEDGALLGVMVSYPRDDHLHVENVAVAKSAQGQGIGRALMDRAEAKAQSLALRSIKLYTNEAMEENFPFYEALGYAETGRGVEDGYKRVYFKKDL